MTSSTLSMYEILVDLGVDKAKAREAVDTYVSKEEARQKLATKQDISDLKDQLRSTIMWVAGLLVGQVAIMTAIMALLFNLYA